MMLDREIILKLLQDVARRQRKNRMLRDASAGLSISLLVLVGFKLIDLISPFRGTTVAAILTVWAIGTAAWLALRLRGNETLEKSAAHIDEKAGAHDEIKTAYWFIRNPRQSPWVDAQLQRAAKSAAKMQVETLCPSPIPRASYVAAALILLLAVLNFLPLPWNNNWLFLQAAPPFSLTGEHKAVFERAAELLKQAEALQQSDLAARLESIVEQLQNGNMSREEFSRSLAELQQTLSERNLDAGRITDGLERIANALASSSLTSTAAGRMSDLDLESAANEIRELAQDLAKSSPAELQEMSERFQEASDASGKGLDQLAQNLKEAANTTSRRDVAGGQRNLEQVARELQRLQQALDSQRLRSEAGEQISNLRDSIGGNQGERASNENASSQNSQGQAKGAGQGKGEGKGQGEGQGQGQGQGEGEGQGQGQGQGEGRGQGDGEGGGEGRGGLGAGRSGPAPARGAPTSLEAQLDREELPVHPNRGSRPGTIVEASERERSKLDYRNVPSQLTPAEKDLLNQDSIPWDQRRFVKEYFEAIRK